MNIEWSSGSEAASLQGDALCLIVSEAQALGEGLSAEWAERIGLLTKAGLFSGRLGQIYLLPVTGRPGPPVVILAGSGNGSAAVHDLRLLMAHAARAAHRLKADTLIVQIPDQLNLLPEALKAEAAGQALAEGLVLGAYRRRQYKLEQPYAGLTAVRLHMERQSEESEDKRWKTGMLRGQVFGEATNLARDLTNLPGNLLTPSELRQQPLK